MTDGSLEGWAPDPGPGLTLEEIVERAFDYRGDVTVIKTDGAELEGYLFNRDRDAAPPFVRMFDRVGDGPYDIPYSEIRTIHFTGRDTAAGNSFAAWLRAKGASKPASGGA